MVQVREGQEPTLQDTGEDRDSIRGAPASALPTQVAVGEATFPWAETLDL